MREAATLFSIDGKYQYFNDFSKNAEGGEITRVTLPEGALDGSRIEKNGKTAVFKGKSLGKAESLSILEAGEWKHIEVNLKLPSGHQIGRISEKLTPASLAKQLNARTQSAAKMRTLEVFGTIWHPDNSTLSIQPVPLAHLCCL